jgi:glycosyltransferase involved in cell wall biosynthesis
MKSGESLPRVSILLPNLNNRPFLTERMRSIVGQTFRDWELVVLDSHSTDGAWEFFQDWAGKDPRIRIMQNRRRGIYPNWNRCIRLALGHYILIAPSDDTMEPDFLERMVRALDENPGCDIAHCKLRIIDENGEPCPVLNWDRLFSTKFFGNWIDRPHIRLAPHDGVLHCGVRTVYTSISQLLVRKRLFDRVGLFSTRFGSAADFEWGMRASLLANTIHVPRYLAAWRVHSRQNTDITQLNAPRQKRKFIKMVRHALRTARRIDPLRLRTLRSSDLTYLYRKERWFFMIKEARRRWAPKPLPWFCKIGIGLNWLGHDPLLFWEFFRQRKNTRHFLHPLSPLSYPREMLQKYGLTGHLVLCPPGEQKNMDESQACGG